MDGKRREELNIQEEEEDDSNAEEEDVERKTKESAEGYAKYESDYNSTSTATEKFDTDNLMNDDGQYEYEDDFEVEEEEIKPIRRYTSNSNSKSSNSGSDDGMQGEYPEIELDGWDTLASLQVDPDLDEDGWQIHYDADIDETEEDDEEQNGQQNDVEFLFEKRHFHDQEDWDVDPNATPQESLVSNFVAKFASSVILLTSDQKFNNEFMKIPETPAKEALSKEAAQLTRTDSKNKYYPRIPPYEPAEKYVSQLNSVLDRCPSIESFFKMKKLVEVQFYLHPGSRMICRECRLDITMFQLKLAIGRFVKVPPTHLDFRRRKNLISDDKTLMDLGAKPNRKIRFTVEINKRIAGAYEIKLPKDRVLVPALDTTIRVKVEKEDGSIYFLNVTIVYSKELKPMIGGFVDQRTNKTFHHAFNSMENYERPIKKTQRNISTQAFWSKVSTIQTLLDKGQQMEKKGLYIPTQNDKVISARPYYSHAYWEIKRTKAAILIQRFWRRWLAIRERRRREDGLIKRVKWAENIRKGRLDQRKAILNEETMRQANPKRIVDLELLYRAINDWRNTQEEYVNHNRWGPERKAALATLTELESDLLLDLERTKNNINIEQRENRNQRCFEKMGKPKRWLSSKTQVFITADDGEKVFVRQLQMIYTQLQLKVEDTPEGLHYRCTLLGQLNFMTKGMKSKLSDMLTQLVAREFNFLRNPKCSPSLLAGIRMRIATTFYFLCQDPKFNPEAKRVQKIPWDPVKLRKDMVQCKGCRRMQYRDEFTIIKGTTVTSRCHTCMNLYRTAILRVDLNLYRHMLKELRRDELAAGIVNSVTFLMDAFDLQFLVDQIWHGQSALSGIDNRYLLRLCRWKKDKPWAPWNCVLLTEEEATAHLQLEHMPNAYKESFFHKVLVKQCTAKTYFEGIAKITVGLDARVEENCKAAGHRKKRLQIIRKNILKKAKFIAMLGTK